MTILFNESRKIAQAIHEKGGVPLVVGGFVRDSILGLPSKDIDIEAHFITPNTLMEALEPWNTDLVGASFGVIKVFLGGDDFIDVSLPRRDNKTGNGHRGFEVSVDPFMGFEEAFRRRDLTINAMGQNMITGELIDPFRGQLDLQRGILREVDPVTFVEDPLRALRVAQFAARFSMTPTKELVELCSKLDLTELPVSRIEQELEKLFDKGFLNREFGLNFLNESGLATQLGLDLDNHTIASASSEYLPNFHSFLAALTHNQQGSLVKLTTRNKDIEKAILLHNGFDHFTESHTEEDVKRLSLVVVIEEMCSFGRAKGHHDRSSHVESLAKSLNIFTSPLEPLLQGRDLVKLGLKPGPRFSVLLKDVQEAQLRGQVSDKDSALEFVSKLI